MKRSLAQMGNQNSVGNKGGRPLEWTDDLIDIETAALHEWIKNPKNYYLVGFANERDIHIDVLRKLADLNVEFRRSFEKAKLIMEQRLVDLAVTRKGDPGFIKFVLQNKSGWKEKTELSGDSGSPIAFLLSEADGQSKDLIKG